MDMWIGSERDKIGGKEVEESIDIIPRGYNIYEGSEMRGQRLEIEGRDCEEMKMSG